MAETHPSRHTLVRFMSADLDRPDAVEVLRHLARGCSGCQATTAELWRPAAAPVVSHRSATPHIDNYDAAIERALGRALDLTDRLQTEENGTQLLADELATHPLPRQLTLVQNSARFWTHSLCEWLLAKGFAVRYDQPRLTLHLAQLAVEIGERLDPRVYGALAWLIWATLSGWSATCRSRIAHWRPPSA
jgi:hypothetical protein